MKNKQIVILLLIITTILIPSFASGTQESSSSVIVTGEISYLEGEVLLNNQIAEIGDIVNSSDTLETAKGAFCEVIFENANIFRLDELTITQINWSESDIILKQGGISAVFNKLDKLIREMKNFTISTPTTVAGVRGTVFYARVEDDSNSYICICNGELAMEFGDSKLDIQSDHHKAYRFTNKNGSVTWESAALLYHDDEKMESVASGISYDIPWDSGEYGH